MRKKNRSLMQNVKDFVEDYAIAHNGETPSTRTIGAAFGIDHTQALRYLKYLAEEGTISYEKGRIRSARIDLIQPEMVPVPSFAEAIPAGPPDEIHAQVDAYLSIPAALVENRRGNYFLLRVRGDSMVDADIVSGDLVIVRECVEAREGEIVVALVNGGSTMKRLLRDAKGPYLWAENNTWEDSERLIGREFQIQGVAVKMVKDVV